MIKVQRTWVRFKSFFGQHTENSEKPPTSLWKTPACSTQTWCPIPTKNPTDIEAPVDHVASMMQNIQQQLASQLQQMQSMMQAIQMQHSAGPQNAHQDYGGRVHGGHENYCGQGGRGAQCRVNWWSDLGGRVSRDLTHHCWNHGMCAYSSKYCRTLTEVHTKDTVWCNKMSGRNRNCTWQVRWIPASKSNVKESIHLTHLNYYVALS